MFRTVILTGYWALLPILDLYQLSFRHHVYLSGYYQPPPILCS
jgi:hypothetical protein